MLLIELMETATGKQILESLVEHASAWLVQLRALATAADASKVWDLRCEIREKLIEFIQQARLKLGSAGH